MSKCCWRSMIWRTEMLSCFLTNERLSDNVNIYITITRQDLMHYFQIAPREVKRVTDFIHLVRQCQAFYKPKQILTESTQRIVRGWERRTDGADFRMKNTIVVSHWSTKRASDHLFRLWIWLTHFSSDLDRKQRRQRNMQSWAVKSE